jgi:ribosomal RNA assembly protein
MEYTKIPKDRIGALIGRSGETRVTIERKARVKLDINSDTGEVAITEGTRSDPLHVWIARDVVSAIGYGFSPEKALLLFDEDYYMDVVELSAEGKRSENDLKRIKSRIIGTVGKTREYIEQTTKAYISVFGKRVSIIGKQDGIGIAKEAIELLVKGKPHLEVYKFLDRSAV